jgi:hypothetical protein
VGGTGPDVLYPRNHATSSEEANYRVFHSAPWHTDSMFPSTNSPYKAEAAEMIDELVTPIILHPTAHETNPRINNEA